MKIVSSKPVVIKTRKVTNPDSENNAEIKIEF